jgi:hypothetical protein
VITDPEEQNLRSLRAFEMTEFTPIKTTRLRREELNRVVIIFQKEDKPRPTAGMTTGLFRTLFEIVSWNIVWSVLGTLLWSTALNNFKYPGQGNR